MDTLQYPIGKYIEQPFSHKKLGEWLFDIKTLPMHVEHAILNLDEAALQSPYRPGGWTRSQVIHHVADSHINAFIRFKLALTEDNPTIKPYDENAWAQLPDTLNLPVNISITLLFSLHLRWYELLKHRKDEDWNRTVFHPEHQRSMTLWYLLGLYAWHGRHHVAHVKIPFVAPQ
ncbi:MAG: putative metal-dependent hydrolase [Chitinophagaceae bacterium]|nr:MAG: putative metal-dependent hydrolase [Chitinophagaceae bacterium]